MLTPTVTPINHAGSGPYAPTKAWVPSAPKTAPRKDSRV